MNDQFKAFAQQLAQKSGALVRQHFFAPVLEIHEKSDGSPVTVADRDAESLMREMIAKEFPDHGIIGEEFGKTNPDAEYVWVLDPIDGTISFTHHCPLFGTLIGLLHKGKPVLGLIHQPIVGQLCLGDGQTTWLNDRVVRMRDTKELSQATLLTTDVSHLAKFKTDAGFWQLQKKTKLFRTWGDCYGYLLLASGQADIMIDPIMHPWDILPLIPIIEGAGGVITTWEGGDAVKGNSAVAASKRLHGEGVKLLTS